MASGDHPPPPETNGAAHLPSSQQNCRDATFIVLRAQAERRQLRMVEFFSGIGGMRLGVELALEDILLEGGSEGFDGGGNGSYFDNNNSNGQQTTAGKGEELDGSKREGSLVRRGGNDEHDGSEVRADSIGNSGLCVTEKQEMLGRPSHSLLGSCVAYEISLHANRTYAHNFAEGDRDKANFAVRTKLVEQLRPSDLDSIVPPAHLWTLSPPCQPFTTTRLSKRLDTSDKRTAGFLAVMSLLSSVAYKPRWILVENVRGFLGSHALRLWYECLERNGYTWREYLLGPMQVGIPNNRTRYYMTAERSDRWRSVPRGSVDTTVPGLAAAPTKGGDEDEDEEQDAVEGVQPLSVYVRSLSPGEEVERYLVPLDALRQPWAEDLPVVNRFDRITHCFTAAYGRVYHRSSGSLLLMPPAGGEGHGGGGEDSEEGVEEQVAVADQDLDREDMTRYAGRLRRFTPEELLSLFGFPPEFEFPQDMELGHRYKLVGNSVNVKVVSKVVGDMLRNFYSRDMNFIHAEVAL